MLRILLFSTFLFVLRADRPSYQKIKLDERYNSVIPKDKDPNSVLIYRIRPDKGLILDCAGFDFSAIRKLNNDKDPDRIHLLTGKSGLFDIVLHPTGETVIDASTVERMKATKEFAGFESHDTVFLAIGSVKTTDGAEHLLTYWIGKIVVQ